MQKNKRFQQLYLMGHFYINDKFVWFPTLSGGTSYPHSPLSDVLFSGERSPGQ